MAPKIALDLDVLTESGIPQELQQISDAINEAGGALTGASSRSSSRCRTAWPRPHRDPNLGGLGIGATKGHANKRGAESHATSLIFEVTATGEKQVLQLGHARAVINGPAKGGVFRSTSMPLDLKIADGSLHFGEVRPRTIPCSGTNGRVRTKTLDSASVLLPGDILINASDITYASMGKQLKKRLAKGFTPRASARSASPRST